MLYCILFFFLLAVVVSRREKNGRSINTAKIFSLLIFFFLIGKNFFEFLKLFTCTKGQNIISLNTTNFIFNRAYFLLLFFVWHVRVFLDKIIKTRMSNLQDLINHDDEYLPSPSPPQPKPERQHASSLELKTSTTEDLPDSVTQEHILTSFEKIKTHFPAARIKKIMQSDEEIGKVAQATPVIVGRALEIFMANLVEVSLLEAKKQGVKRITASHVKSAIENTEQFDFLVEAVEKYPSLKN